MMIAEAQSQLRVARGWLATLRSRQAIGIVDAPEVEARLQAAVRAAEQAVLVAEAEPDPAQLEQEAAEQRHRVARHRQAAAAQAAHAKAQQVAARREQIAARREAHRARAQRALAWRARPAADVAERVGRTDTAGFPTELLQRSQDVRVPYAVSFRETYADDAFYFDAIAPYSSDPYDAL
jgi:hypothetical protein